jgi:hypothetical protein
MSVQNIINIYLAATDDEKADGIKWYKIALREGTKIGKEFGISKHTCTGVIAALSPNLGWTINVRNAYDMVKCFASGGTIDDVTVSSYPLNKQKAWRMLEEKMVRKDKIMKLLNGPKTTAFFANMHGIDVVTVDGHAKNIYDGQRRTLKNNNVGVKEYREISKAYHDAADMMGIKGFQMQAITWVAWRRMHGINR